ncbi:MAG: hypothetical protein ACJ76R_15950 [Solirubrobacteraceae bacterium]
MRLVSWNVAGRVRRLDEQAAAIAGEAPDLVAHRDGFRTLHGYADRSATWAWPTGGGHRLDHLIVSAAVEVERCEYRHEWRTDRLSDHSGPVADLAIVET